MWDYFYFITVNDIFKLTYGHIAQSAKALCIGPLPWASGNPVAIQCAWSIDPNVHWNATGERVVGSQCVSNGLPVVFQCAPIMQINTGSPLGHHWVLASASVVPVASQFTCCSSGLPVCSKYANQHWIATGTPLGASLSQCGSSGIPMYLWLQGSSSVFQLCKLTLDCYWDTTGC